MKIQNIVLLGGIILFFSACFQETEKKNPAVVSVVPADGASKISVLTKLEVAFSNDVDVDSLNASIIELEYAGTYYTKQYMHTVYHDRMSIGCAFCHGVVSSSQMPALLNKPYEYVAEASKYKVPTSIAYDSSTKTVTFSPLKPLEYAGTYELRLNGIKDVNGKDVPPFAASFSTSENQILATLRPAQSGKNFTVYSYEAGKTVLYNAAGPDGDWQATEDNVVSAYTAGFLDENGRQEKVVYYGDSGGDGQWFTENDVVQGYDRYIFDPNGKLNKIVYYDSSGSNGVWFDDDDEIKNYQSYSYNGSGNLVAALYYANSGLDKMWFSDDDVAEGNCLSSVFDANGKKILIITYSAAGPDENWNTEDDLVSSYRRMEYDSNGQLSHTIAYKEAGLDGKWSNEDDVVSAYTGYSYDTQGNQTKIVNYLGAGDDNSWFTPDDVISSYDAFTFNDTGNETRYVIYNNSGSDGVWFSEDDQIANYQSFEYNDNGQLQFQKFSNNSPGVDGVWFTSDDPLATYIQFVYDPNGNLSMSIIYSSPGQDGLWFTQDDVKQQETNFASQL